MERQDDLQQGREAGQEVEVYTRGRENEGADLDRRQHGYEDPRISVRSEGRGTDDEQESRLRSNTDSHAHDKRNHREHDQPEAAMGEENEQSHKRTTQGSVEGSVVQDERQDSRNVQDHMDLDRERDTTDADNTRKNRPDTTTQRSCKQLGGYFRKS